MALTYNGSEQPLTLKNYNSAQVTLGGTIKGTDAREYEATVTPTANYQWSDGTTTAKTVKWTIAKKAGSLVLSTTAVNLDPSNLSKAVTVTREGDGIISVSSNNTSVATASVTGTTVIINHVNRANGTAVITVKVGADTNHTAPADQNINVTAQFATVYGVEWNWTSNGPTKGTRTDAAASFTDPSPAVSGGTGSSPFDNLMPWAGMVKETRTGGVMVKEPKYWYKWTKTGKKLKLQIADGPVEGFHVDPVNMDRGDGKGELDFSYIARYRCTSDTSKSQTGREILTNMQKSYGRSAAGGYGSNYFQFDFAQFWYIGMLFLVEFADWNSEAIGRGSGAYSGLKNGKTDTMQYHTGTMAGTRNSYGYTQYRNIEGYFDSVYDWMDGCYCTSNGLYVIKNPADFRDDTKGILVGKPSPTGYPSDFAIPTTSGLEWALYPCAMNGSTTTYVPDSWEFDSSSSILYHGGGGSEDNKNGLFHIGCVDPSYYHYTIAIRFQERPPKTT